MGATEDLHNPGQLAIMWLRMVYERLLPSYNIWQELTTQKVIFQS